MREREKGEKATAVGSTILSKAAFCLMAQIYAASTCCLCMASWSREKLKLIHLRNLMVDCNFDFVVLLFSLLSFFLSHTLSLLSFHLLTVLSLLSSHGFLSFIAHTHAHPFSFRDWFSKKHNCSHFQSNRTSATALRTIPKNKWKRCEQISEKIINRK